MPNQQDVNVEILELLKEIVGGFADLVARFDRMEARLTAIEQFVKSSQPSVAEPLSQD